MHDPHVNVYSQDAYALCRVFKKSAPGPKIIEHYGATFEMHPQWATNDHSSTMELSPEGREDLDSCGYQLQMESCSSGFMQRPSYNASAAVDGKWMQYLADEAFQATNNPPFQSPSSFSYVPSQVMFSSFTIKLMRQ